MNLLCWNCRGIGNALTVQELRELTIKFSPRVLCLVETQISGVSAKNLKSTLGFVTPFLLTPLVRVEV